MPVYNLQIGEDALCDKHDEDDNNSDEMVRIHEIFSHVEKEEVDILKEA